MTDLNFNINAFAKPTTGAERIALLDEALRLADELDAHIDAMEAALEKQAVDA